MNDPNSILSMTEHAGYVWPTYAIAAVVLVGIVVATLRTLSKVKTELAAAEAALADKEASADEA